jgi:hypothetical protein
MDLVVAHGNKLRIGESKHVPCRVKTLAILLWECGLRYQIKGSYTYSVEGVDDDQWRYSPDRVLASLYGFHDSFIVRCGVISSTIDLF